MVVDSFYRWLYRDLPPAAFAGSLKVKPERACHSFFQECSDGKRTDPPGKTGNVCLPARCGGDPVDLPDPGLSALCAGLGLDHPGRALAGKRQKVQ